VTLSGVQSLDITPGTHPGGRRRARGIAVVGFGSLIWKPGSGSGVLILSSKWHRDGPLLRVEYSRVSSDRRLTLVIVPDAQPQRTLWAYSGCDNAAEARENLRAREGKGVLTEEIGLWTAGSDHEIDEDAMAISGWAGEKGLEAVVWWRLPPKDRDGGRTVMSAEQALEYLSCLRGEDRRLAEEYVSKTPSQIDTEVRKAARERLGWSDHPLPIELFES